MNTPLNAPNGIIVMIVSFFFVLTNSYGHPHEETLKRLTEVGSVVATTPQYGAITMDVTSGGKFMVSHWRKGIIKQKDVAIVAGNT